MATTSAVTHLHPRRSIDPMLSRGPKLETPLSWACAKGRHYACTKADCPCMRHLDENQPSCCIPEKAAEPEHPALREPENQPPRRR
jgi:hypothetical protein